MFTEGKWLNTPNSDILVYSSGLFANIGKPGWNKGLTDTLLQARIYFGTKKKKRHTSDLPSDVYDPQSAHLGRVG